jgi:hypothetical protein
MRFTLEILSGYLRAELFERKTAEETREFVRAVTAKALEADRERVLIRVHSSKPIFRVEQYGASAALKELAARPAVRVALVATEEELHAAHQYLEVLARQLGANVRAFRDEAPAVGWLLGPA